MKRIVLWFLAIIVAYSVYFDITVGTLPSAKTAAIMTSTNGLSVQNGLNSKLVKVKPGDTILSLVERNEGTLPVSIKRVIIDFQDLNNGIQPEKIQIGKEYRIPVYHR